MLHKIFGGIVCATVCFVVISMTWSDTMIEKPQFAVDIGYIPRHVAEATSNTVAEINHLSGLDSDQAIPSAENAFTQVLAQFETLQTNLKVDLASGCKLYTNASDWKVVRTGPLTFDILSPPDICQHSNPIFDVRLINKEVLRTIELKPPVQGEKQLYSVSIDPAEILHKGRYELEVTLQFGHYLGGQSGQPCPAEVCSEEEILSNMRMVQWSGQSIQNESPLYVTIASESESLPSSPQLCTSFNELNGYWNNRTFQPVHSELPRKCHLMLPDMNMVSLIIGTNSKWLHFIGDSNTREFFQKFTAHQLSIRGCQAHTFSGEKYPGRLLCMKNDMILSYAWWFQEEASNHTDVTALHDLATMSLSEFCATSGFNHMSPQMLRQFQGLKAQRIYISMGSHAPALSAYGAEVSLDLILDSGLQKSHVWKSIRFLPTLAVNPQNIPARFGQQSLVRNNVLIAARNQVLSRKVPDKIIDIWSLSVAAHREFMRANDAVHYQNHVYFTIGNVLFTEWLKIRD